MRASTRVMLSAFMGTACLAASSCSSKSASLDGNGQDVLLALAGFSSPEKQAQQEREFIDESERLVAECLKKAGFEYTPMGADSVSTVDASAFEFAYSTQYAMAKGFGSSTIYPPPPPPASSAISRNADFRNSLSDAARDTFDQKVIDCSETAADGARAKFNYPAAEKAYERIDTQIRASGEYQTALATWADCAAGQGQTYESFDAAREDFKQRVLALPREQSLTSPPSPELLALQQEEKRVATMLGDCTDSFGATIKSLYSAEISKT